MQKINPCLWFDNQAEEAARFYTSIFKPSKLGNVARFTESMAAASGQKQGSIVTVEFELENLKILGLNGGPIFKFTPGGSIFVWCKTEKEINELWEKLSQGGSVLWDLKKYHWAEKYGWCTDRYGVPWQLMLEKGKKGMAPAILFVGDLLGKGEEAINFYVSQFKNSKTESLFKDSKTNHVAFASFTLDGQEFVLMEGDGPKEYQITHAVSFIVNCENQAEVDEYWEKLSQGGSTEPCGWLKDKYGVSWQVVPTVLSELMTISDPAKVEKVTKTMLTMKKLNIEQLTQASL